MTQKKITEKTMNEFKYYLYEQERSKATIDKYMRDLKKFYLFLGNDRTLNKENVILYKRYLTENYKPNSANSMIVAINSFLEFAGAPDCKVKQLKVQKNLFCHQDKELTKEEYKRLVSAARVKKNERISLLMQTICSTGIRVSEHRYITVEGVREGKVMINNKGKSRIIFLPPELTVILQDYCRRKKIETGAVFITKSGKPLDRSNIWTMMKRLCQEAGVDQKKVFPHNLRHLFAFTFYEIEKDIIRLADVLGHSSVDTARIYTVSSGWEHKKILSKLGLVLDSPKKSDRKIDRKAAT